MLCGFVEDVTFKNHQKHRRKLLGTLSRVFYHVDYHVVSIYFLPKRSFLHVLCNMFLHYLVLSQGIDLENIVYYKDDTHYFVMTAKKQSLLDKGVIRHVSIHFYIYFLY